MDGRTTDIQRETIIPRHYCVAVYKNLLQGKNLLLIPFKADTFQWAGKKDFDRTANLRVNESIPLTPE